MAMKRSAGLFLTLLRHPFIENFINHDICCMIADKFHLAAVYFYFERAKFNLGEFNPLNFFTALYISHEIYEDNEDYRGNILYYLFHETYDCSEFFSWRIELLERMNFQVFVSEELCQLLFAIAPDRMWRRNRVPEHAVQEFCSKCLIH